MSYTTLSFKAPSEGNMQSRENLRFVFLKEGFFWENIFWNGKNVPSEGKLGTATNAMLLLLS